MLPFHRAIGPRFPWISHKKFPIPSHKAMSRAWLSPCYLRVLRCGIVGHVTRLRHSAAMVFRAPTAEVFGPIWMCVWKWGILPISFKLLLWAVMVREGHSPFSRMRSEGFPFIVGGLGVGPLFAASWSARRFRVVFASFFASFFASLIRCL